MKLYDFFVYAAAYIKSGVYGARKKCKAWTRLGARALNTLSRSDSDLNIRKLFYELDTSTLYIYARQVDGPNKTVRARRLGAHIALDLDPESRAYRALARALSYWIPVNYTEHGISLAASASWIKVHMAEGLALYSAQNASIKEAKKSAPAPLMPLPKVSRATRESLRAESARRLGAIKVALEVEREKLEIIERASAPYCPWTPPSEQQQAEKGVQLARWTALDTLEVEGKKAPKKAPLPPIDHKKKISLIGLKEAIRNRERPQK